MVSNFESSNMARTRRGKMTVLKTANFENEHGGGRKVGVAMLRRVGRRNKLKPGERRVRTMNGGKVRKHRYSCKEKCTAAACGRVR